MCFIERGLNTKLNLRLFGKAGRPKLLDEFEEKKLIEIIEDRYRQRRSLSVQEVKNEVLSMYIL
jgi:hypothetical protein